MGKFDKKFLHTFLWTFSNLFACIFIFYFIFFMTFLKFILSQRKKNTYDANGHSPGLGQAQLAGWDDVHARGDSQLIK
jgi:hypothetical protein